MNIEEIREYCLVKPGVTEGFPFDESTLVFKVMNMIYVQVSTCISNNGIRYISQAAYPPTWSGSSLITPMTWW